jgi:hypothetical protein
MTVHNMDFKSISDFEKYVSHSPYRDYGIRFSESSGGSYFLLKSTLGWRVIIKEPGRSDVYYDQEFKSLNEAAHDILNLIDNERGDA